MTSKVGIEPTIGVIGGYRVKFCHTSAGLVVWEYET